MATNMLILSVVLLAVASCGSGSLVPATAPAITYVNTIPYNVPPFASRYDFVSRVPKAPLLAPALPPLVTPRALPSLVTPRTLPLPPSALSPFFPGFFGGFPSPVPAPFPAAFPYSLPAPFPSAFPASYPAPFPGPFTIPGSVVPPFFYRR